MKSKSASSDVRVDRDHRGRVAGPDGTGAPNDSGEIAIPKAETDSGEIPATIYGVACDPNDPTCEACQ